MESAPTAPKVQHLLNLHGRERNDNWYWLNEVENPEVLKHLKAENSYSAKQMEDTVSLQDVIFNEIKSRVKETDLSVPVRDNDWWYYTSTEQGKQYAIHARKLANGDEFENAGPEQIILDENVLAEGHDYFSLGSFEISNDGNLLAIGVDYSGDEIYETRFIDLRRGAEIGNRIKNTFYGAAFSFGANYYFYVRCTGPMRANQVWRHNVHDDSDDTLVFEETDDRYFVSLGSTRTKEIILINSGSKSSNDIRYLWSNRPLEEFKVIQERLENCEYSVDHHKSKSGKSTFYIASNYNAPNFAVYKADLETTEIDNWKPVIGHDPMVKIDEVDCFEDFLVISKRENANSTFSIYSLVDGTQTQPDFSQECFSADIASNPTFGTRKLQYGFGSMTTPNSVFEFDVDSGLSTLLKEQPVLGDFNRDDYTSWRQWATAQDGTKIPISIVGRADRKNEPGPLLLYGYGAYEISIDPYFSATRLSLLDRGFLFAIAHVRGGGEMGRLWYEGGRRANKVNTFKDFISCARHLIDEGYCTSEQLAIRGGSAGGLLIGAVINMEPELFGAAVAEVPFVDALTTMCDPTLPLTVHEYDEWGDPGELASFEHIAQYSPVDNVRSLPYPTLLVTAGVSDPRVGYYEPAKWVQLLRENTTSDNQVLLKTELGAGHAGPSGRYDAWKDEAFVYAFLIKALGLPIA